MKETVAIPTRGITSQACVIAPFEPNASICQHTDTDLILRIAVSVNAIGGGSIYSTNREAPIKPPKTMDVKKPGKPSQVNRVKISYCFFKRLRTRWDIPKLKFGSSDWTRTSDIRINSPPFYRLNYRGIV